MDHPLKTLAVLFVLFITLTSANAQEARIPTSVFFQRDAIEDMKISPDGEHLAISMGQEEGSRLVILNLSDRKAVAEFYTTARYKIGSYFWANNERLVYSTLVFQGGLDIPFQTGELFAVNIDNTQNFQLAGFGTGDRSVYFISHLLMDDPERIRVTGSEVRRGTIARSRPTSYLLDIYSAPRAPGRSTQANLSDSISSPLPWGDLHADNSGAVRLAMATSEEGAVEVRFRNKDSNEWRDIANDLVIGDEGVIDRIVFVGFSQDNESFYYLSPGEHGTRALFRYSPTDPSSTPVLQHEQFDINPSDVIVSNKRDAILGIKFVGDVLEQHYVSDHPDVLLHQRLDASFPGEMVRITSATQDGSKAVIGVFSSKRLGDYYLLDVASMRIESLGGSSADLDPQLMADVTPFGVRTPDGLTLHGYVTRPRGATGPLPMIVIPHGGPIGVRDYPAFNREAQLLAHHGYVVLQVNFRGSGGYGREFERAGFQQWGLGMIDDITLATRWAVQRELADPAKICIYGASYGGYAALTSVVREPERYQCAVGYAGVYDLLEMDRSDIPFQPGGETYIATVIGTDRDALRAQSPTHNTDKIKVPVLIAHGGEDRRAPVFHARDLIEALEKSGVEHEVMIEDGEGHGFYSAENNVIFYDRMLNFFDRHLKEP